MILSRKFKLNPTQEQENILLDTLKQYKQSIDTVLEYGFKNKKSSGNELHKATYYPLRKQTQLPSQLVCSARVRATEILKSIRTKTKGKFNTKQPKSHKFPSIRFDRNSCVISDSSVKFTTIQGRIEIPFFKYSFADNIKWKDIQKSCELKYQNKKWYLIVFVDQPIPEPKPINKVLGIDRGCKHIAVCSNNKFFDSKHLRNIKGRYSYLRKRLQNKGTKSAKRLIKKVGRKEHRFVKDVNHCVSKQIVSLPFDTFVFEKLNIKRSKKQGKRFNSILNGWSYYQFEQFVKYKSQLAGKQIEYVDARYTSQKCSCCGHISRSNRNSQSLFHCKSCSFQLNADLNASRNIENNFKASLATSSASRAHSIVHTTQLLTS